MSQPAQGGLLLAAFFAIATMEFGCMFVLGVEHGAPGANILTGPEALWWGMTTITTVGYGDVYPVTDPGQVAASITMLIGIALIGTFTGYLANTFLAPRSAAAPSDDDDPRAQLEVLLRQMDETHAMVPNSRQSCKRSWRCFDDADAFCRPEAGGRKAVPRSSRHAAITRHLHLAAGACGTKPFGRRLCRLGLIDPRCRAIPVPHDRGQTGLPDQWWNWLRHSRAVKALVRSVDHLSLGTAGKRLVRARAY